MLLCWPRAFRGVYQRAWVRIARGMDIKGFIEWIGHDSGSAFATVFPYLLVGVALLYVLVLVVGYLRVSQVGVGADSHIGGSPPPLPAAAQDAVSASRGIPYCPTDNLLFHAGARICPRCEGDLLVHCANCGTTIQASDDSCYHCGTRDTLMRVSDED
jgi:hypothetical protein